MGYKVRPWTVNAHTFRISSLRWPPLKNAIKYLLNETFDQWPTSSAPIMHPAASLLQQQAIDEASTSSISINGISDEPNLTSSPNKDSSFPTNGSSLQDEASSSASPNTATAALALSSRFQREGENTGDFENTIKEADLQAFFPSKRRAPAEWGGSWGKRLESKSAIDDEKRMIFSMLDDFEGQPPFTIQRLAELILRPSEHHHTLPKYVSALKRLLSVTATRDAFPAYAGEDDQEGFMVSVPGTNGHTSSISAMSRSRTGTPVPGSPSTAPLFSPIPFLMKSGDEGMPGKAGQEDLMMADEDVPGMELGGADRTTETAVELAKISGAGAGSGVASGRNLVESNGSSPEEAGKPVAVIHPASEPTSLSDTHHRAGSTNVTDAGNGPSNNLPLGVPSGRVDELDQLGEKHGKLPPVDSSSVGGGAKALSSTTTSTVAEPEAKDSSLEDEDSVRAIKRVRSERNLTDLEEKEEAGK